jgi:hypothetical protein
VYSKIVRTYKTFQLQSPTSYKILEILDGSDPKDEFAIIIGDWSKVVD